MNEIKANELENFKQNLEVAKFRAGNRELLCQFIGITPQTYYNWKRFPPVRRNTDALAKLASVLGMPNVDELYERALPVPIAEESEVKRFLHVMDEIRALRKKYTWGTICFWLQQFRTLNELVDGDWDGLEEIVNKMKPPTPSMNKDKGVLPVPSDEQEAGRESV